MLFYEIQVDCRQNLNTLPFTKTLIPNFERQKDSKVFKEALQDKLFEYNNARNIISLIPSTRSLNSSKLSLVACYKYEIGQNFDLTSYVLDALQEVFDLRPSIISVQEISTFAFYNKAFEDSSGFRVGGFRNLFINDSEIGFSFLGEENDIYLEKFYAQASKDEILQKAREIMPDSSLMEELQRIFSKDYGQFLGVPIHYHIITASRESAQRIIELLVQALKYSNRLLTTRTSIAQSNSDNTMNSDEIEDMITNNYGASTVIEFSEKEDYSGNILYCSDYFLNTILKYIERYNQQRQFIFVEIVGKQKGANYFFEALTQRLPLIEIKEGTGTAEAAEKILRQLWQQSKYNAFLDFNYVKKQCLNESVKVYNVSSIYKSWQNFIKTALHTELYTAYKPLAAVRIQKEAKKREEASPYFQLNNMIGLTTVKKTADKIIATFAVQKQRQHLGVNKINFSRHMLFTGNPGTAKTTVARLLAQIFAEKGIIKTAKFIECGRADLIGQYVGQTAIKVQNYFQKAKGGVLFIDEAYSLVDGYRGHYGDEAINTIVQEMENNRDDTIVIFAGYPEPMQDFINTNEGLRSRINFQIDFPDYSVPELTAILELMAKEKSYIFTKGAQEKCRNILSQASCQANAGNGRFVRNLLEQIIMQQATRIYSAGENAVWDKYSISLITAEDVPDDFLKADMKAKTIGFFC